ncbi:MAG TPA: glycosyltransferase family 39 protein [Nitrospinota bacterium]|nr:glycosyltransferase family 39 protein [Nitrospinota bacterium]|tara:strand:- start:13090 stop:16104 length:3015 start_codon:yes stop_codon:yes gene_type:complete
MAISRLTWVLGSVAIFYLILACFVLIAGQTHVDMSYHIYFATPFYPMVLTISAVLILAALHLMPLKRLSPKGYVKLYFTILTILLLFLMTSVGLLIFSLVGVVDITLPISFNTGNVSKLVFIIILVLMAIIAVETYKHFPTIQFEKSSKFLFKVPIAVLLVVIFGTVLRIWGLGHGVDQHMFHPDAPKQIMAVKEYKKGHYTFDMDNYLFGKGADRYVAGYPFFSMHLTRLGSNIYEGVKKFTGFGALKKYSYDESQRIVMTSRWLNVLYSIIIILVIYRTGSIWGGELAGLFASLLAAVSFSHLQMSKYLCADIPMSMFASIAIYCATLNLEVETKRNYLLFGLFAGLAAASKYNGVLIYLYLGLVYLINHRTPNAIKKNIGKVVLAACVGGLVFFLTSANFLTDPERALVAIQKSMTLSANMWAEDGLISTRINALIEKFSYHKWVFFGLFQPLPFWLVILSMIMALYYKGLRILVPISALLLIFAFGKWSMPVSATHHYFNIWPLAVVVSAVGLSCIIKKFSRPISIVLTIALTSYLAYQGIQDSSVWSLPDRNVESVNWIRNNLSSAETVIDDIGVMQAIPTSSYDGSPNSLLADFHYGSAEQAISLHRDGHIYMFLNKAKNLLYPPVNFLSREKSGIVYAGFGDMVVTRRAVTTAWEGVPKRVSRMIYSKGGLEQIVIWVSNISNEQNLVTLKVGHDNYSFSLGPKDEAPLVVVNDPTPSIFYRGNFVPVFMESEKPANWVLAIEKSHIADLYRYKKKNKTALKLYRDSSDLYGLLRALPLVEEKGIREKIIETINAINPEVISLDLDKPDADLWEKVSGYKGRIFDSQLYRNVMHEKRWSANAKRTGTLSDSSPYFLQIPANDEMSLIWNLSVGGKLFGPYVSLLMGDYVLEAEIIAKPKFISMHVDVTSQSGRIVMGEKTVQASDMRNSNFHKLAIPFTVNKPMIGMVEFRFTTVTGGDVTLKNIKIKGDYLASTLRLLSEARGQKESIDLAVSDMN